MKTKQTVQGLQAFAFCLVKLNSTVVFKRFKDLKDLIIKENALFVLKLYKAFQTTVRIAMISKVMIKFRSKFQLQIILQFYWTYEKN